MLFWVATRNGNREGELWKFVFAEMKTYPLTKKCLAAARTSNEADLREILLSLIVDGCYVDFFVSDFTHKCNIIIGI